MIIKILSNLMHNGSQFYPNDEIDVADKQGEELISIGVAEEIRQEIKVEEDQREIKVEDIKEPKQEEVNIEKEIKVEEEKQEKKKRRRRTKKEMEEVKSEK